MFDIGEFFDFTLSAGVDKEEFIKFAILLFGGAAVLSFVAGGLSYGSSYVNGVDNGKETLDDVYLKKEKEQERAYKEILSKDSFEIREGLKQLILLREMSEECNK